MKTLFRKDSGEIVEIVNGQLECWSDQDNWNTITEWLLAQGDSFYAKVDLMGGRIYVSFPDDVPTHMMGSLLEAFEYQD